MTIGSLVLLVLLGAFLITSFDWTASTRERHMVGQGFQRQVDQFEELIVPQADWDDAVAKLDHHFDPEFADTNFGSQLHTFYGFTHTFLVDGNGRPIYASVDGHRSSPDTFAPFVQGIAPLLAQVRASEARRPPIRPSAKAGETVTRPIQANGVIRTQGKVYIIIATLTQPDVGRVLPRGPGAPVAITAMPIERAMLGTFAARYLVDDLELVDGRAKIDGTAYFALRSPTGEEVAALAWTPRKPGTMLFREQMVPLLGALSLLSLVGWILARRTRVLIDELISSEWHAKHIAYHDQLTGVPNRALLFARLPEMLAAVGRDYPLLAMLCVDLDRFKEVNDTLGHDAGDELLRRLAESLKTAAATVADTLIARLGGDEFVLACPVSDRAEAEGMAARCIDIVNRTIRRAYGQIELGCSIGVVLVDETGADPSAILRRGDMALYRAKNEGRGRVAFFEPEMDEAFRMRRVIEDSLRDSLRRDAFEMVYQPQVDINGKAHSAEALLRWNHPELGEISPAMFIPLAEERGMILAIGEFVLRRVFEETAHWRHLRVAINVSAVQMRTPGFAAQVLRLAAHAGADPSRYEIELTETALLGDGPATTENFEVLRSLGFSIALDDFGTGYSSLSLLHRFPVDKIKIDRSFVSALGEGAEVTALVGAIVKLARSFRLGVIAEGVETEEQRRQLIMSGCTEFQGYLTGKPMSAAQIAERLEPAPPQQRLAHSA